MGQSMLLVLLSVAVVAWIGWSHRRRRSARTSLDTTADDALVEWVAELRATPATETSTPAIGAGSPRLTGSSGPARRLSPVGPSRPYETTGPVGRQDNRRPPGSPPFTGTKPPPARRPDRADRTAVAAPAEPIPAVRARGVSAPVLATEVSVRTSGQDVSLPDDLPSDADAPTRYVSLLVDVGPERTAAGPEGAGPARVRGRGARFTGSLRVLTLVALGGLATGTVLGGPVAGVVAATYGVLGVRGVLRGRAARQADRLRRQQLDELCGLAADLRAGLPVPATVAMSADAGGARIARLTRAAVRLADRTGAPLAELVERIEADARSTDRGLAAAAAQAAGARATAWLLAALPLGGVGLGYGIGVDPVRVLLHTPLGAVAALAAVVLQVAGLFWTERLTGSGRGGR